jgi:DnaA family protein
MKQIPLAIGPEPLPTFDSFVIGSNAAALAYLRAGTTPAAPTYLWGPAGCGKSHLLHALLRERQRSGDSAGYFDAANVSPWIWREDWTLVVVDRCELLDAERQQAAFALFVQATAHDAQWVAAGRLPPVDLALRDDLRTRLGWGQVFALQPLAENEVRAVLRSEADRRGIFLGDEVMDHVLTRFARDLKSLMALLDQLDHYALARQRAVTVPLLRQMLQDADATAGSAA